MVADEDCTDFNCYPIYSHEASDTAFLATSERDFAPWASSGIDTTYRCKIVTDRVCLYQDRSCATDVGFLVVGEDWTFRNILGLAPKSLTDGPVLIQNLFNNQAIDEQRATLEFVPIDAGVNSKLTLGSLNQDTGNQIGQFNSHKLKANIQD